MPVKLIQYRYQRLEWQIRGGNIRKRQPYLNRNVDARIFGSIYTTIEHITNIIEYRVEIGVLNLE